MFVQISAMVYCILFHRWTIACPWKKGKNDKKEGEWNGWMKEGREEGWMEGKKEKKRKSETEKTSSEFGEQLDWVPTVWFKLVNFFLACGNGITRESSVWTGRQWTNLIIHCVDLWLSKAGSEHRITISAPHPHLSLPQGSMSQGPAVGKLVTVIRRALH